MSKLFFNNNNLALKIVSDKGSIDINNPSEITYEDKIDRYRLEVSLLCDLKCQYCVVHMNKVAQQGMLMDMDTAKQIVCRFNNEVGKSGTLLLMGGEPLMNWSVVSFIVENCIGHVMIFTNSYKLDMKKIEFLKDHDVMILTSLDGYSLEQNSARFYPDVQRRFDIVTANIKNAINAKCKVGICCVVHQNNVDDLMGITKYFVEELGAISISFAYPHYTAEKSATNSFSIVDYTNKLCEIWDYVKNNGVYVDQFGKKLNAILSGQKVLCSCKVGVSQRTFYPDGSETQCTNLDTLKNYALNDFINHLPIKNNKCNGCIAQCVCGGGCPWDAAINSNDIGVDDRLCYYNRTLVKHILSDIQNEIKNIENLSKARDIIYKIYNPLISPQWDN